jgi:hypothetical protein
LQFSLKYLGEYKYSSSVAGLFDSQQSGGGAPQTP